MRKAHKNSLIDIMNENFLEEGLKSLLAEFRDWSSVEGRGTKQLWGMLGNVYEFAFKIENNTAAKAALVRRVQEVEGVKNNNRWIPEKKKSAELLITLLLGLKEETKATKSQWLGAINAAEKAKIQTKSDDYTEWLKNIGGIQAARRTLKKQHEFRDFRSWVTEIKIDIQLEDQRISFPKPIDAEDLIDDIGLVIVQRDNETGNAVPLVTLANERLIVSAIQRFVAAQKRNQQEFAREMKREDVRERAAKLSNWREYKKRYPGEFDTFEDYLEDVVSKI